MIVVDKEEVNKIIEDLIQAYMPLLIRTHAGNNTQYIPPEAMEPVIAARNFIVRNSDPKSKLKPDVFEKTKEEAVDVPSETQDTPSGEPGSVLQP